MSARQVLERLLRAARVRAGARVVALGLPLLLVLAVLGWRLGGADVAWLALALGALAIAASAMFAARRLDPAWLARRLDARDPRMEDSAALLLPSAPTGNPLQQLQRQRLEQRLLAAPPPDLRQPWPQRALLVSIPAALLATAAVVLWPARPASPTQNDMAPAAATETASPTSTRIDHARLAIAPPAYTGLPTRSEDGFEARVPEGANVRVALRFVPQPSAATLAFHDGRKVPMRREGDTWIAQRRIDAPLLYRIELDGAPPLKPNRLHRLDVMADRPPQVRAVVPEETLTLHRAGQRNWALSFEAEDDYGLAAGAPLRITLAQGEGESIRFEERRLVLQGRGGGKRRRYAHTFDLAALGLTPGSDFVVQLSVTDNRAAGAQTTHSPSFILRWPPQDTTETSAIDGVVKKALPAYFRSQRQIIIDTEALIAQRRKLDGEAFLAKSDGIGVDQRLLRLRYGQFLGEESEGAPQLRSLAGAARTQPDCEPPQALLPTAEAEAEAEAARQACEAAAAEHAQTDASQSSAHANEEAGAEGGDEHGHDAATPAQAPAVFGSAGDVLAEFGHTHDDSEAATLLDPETRRTLKAALDQMWQAELHLRQGEPDRALPYEYKALDYIKQVQQAGRVYLARVGSELPPIDESRRLGGEREGLAPRTDLLVAATPSSPVLAGLWRALAERSDAPLDLDGAERWLRANERRVPDALGVLAAIDSVRNEPDCASCRALLRSRLWPLLPRPPAKPLPRTAPDRRGQAYLDALRGETR